MAQNNRDVRMTLSVETLGTDGIKKLQSEVLGLAKEAGDAAPEFERLAAEIGQLGANAETLRSFEVLAGTFERLKQEQIEAAAASEKLAADLVELRAASETAAQAQREAQRAVNEQAAAIRNTQNEVKALKAEYRGAARDTDEYRDSFNSLNARLVEQQNRQDELRQALALSRAAVTDAAREQRAANREYDAAETAVRKATRAVQEQAQVVEQAKGVISGLGLSADDLAASQGLLVQQLNLVGEAAREQAAAITRAAAANEAAAAAAQKQLAAEEAIDAAQQAITDRFLRGEELKRASRERTAALQAERVQDEIAAAQRVEEANKQALARQLAEEQAAGERLIALKASIRDRIAALANERAAREREASLAAQRAAEQAAEASRRAAQDLENAFSTIGVRSIQAVEAEIKDVQLAMQKVQSESGQTGAALASSMAAGKARIQELQREIRELTGQLTLADQASNLFRNSMGQIAAGNLIADAIGALVERVKEMGRQFVTVNIQAETMRRALNAIYKDSALTEQQIGFLNRTASAAGISISGIADSFVKFSAATRASNIPLEVTNQVFASLTRAGATLGLSTERVQLALDALGQIASKGVVSMEELRQQLGDSLPGALSLTAKGLGITDAELIKLVESGRLASRDFFPALNKGLQTLAGETDGIVKSWNDFKNNLTLTAQQAGANGGVAILTTAIKALNIVVTSIVGVLSDLLAMVTSVAKVFGILLGAVRTLTNPMDALRQVFSDLNDSIAANSDRTAVALGLMTQTEAAARAAARGKTEEAKATDAATAALNQSVEGYRRSVEAASQYGGATSAATTANRILSDSSTELGSRYVQLGVQIAGLASTLEADVVVRGKNAKAAEQQAEAIKREAQARNEAGVVVEATRRAGELVVEAARQEAEARTNLAATLAVELQAKLQLAQAEEGGLAARKAELDLLQQKLDKAAAEAEAAREAVRNIEARAAAEEAAAKREVESLQASAKALADKNQIVKDNSANLAVYREAMLNTAEALEKVRAAAEAGRATQAQLTAAEKEAASAAALYKDAVEDLTANLEASARSKKAAIDLSIAGLQLELEVAKSDEARARRLGNEEGVRAALIRQKNIEIQIAELQLQAQKLEAEASIAIAKAKLAELEASGQLTNSKRIELQTEIQLAEVKLKQVDIRREVVNRMREEVNALASSASNIERETTSVDKNTESWEANANARLKAASAARAGVDSEGFTTNSRGERVSMELPTWLSIFNQLKSRGLNDEQARRIAAEFTDSNGQVQYNNNPGQIKYGRGTGMSLQAAVDAAAGEALRNNVPSSGGGGFLTQGFPQPSSAAPTGTTSGSRTITINIGGRSTRVNVASQADAAALESVLRQLESAASRGG